MARDLRGALAAAGLGLKVLDIGSRVVKNLKGAKLPQLYGSGNVFTSGSSSSVSNAESYSDFKRPSPSESSCLGSPNIVGMCRAFEAIRS